jgi:hypothetical protein
VLPKASGQVVRALPLMHAMQVVCELQDGRAGAGRAGGFERIEPARRSGERPV